MTTAQKIDVVDHLRQLSSEEVVQLLHLSGPQYRREVHTVLQKCFEKDESGLNITFTFLLHYASNVLAVGSLLSEIESYSDPERRDRILEALDQKKWDIDKSSSDSAVLSTWLRVYVEHFISV